MIEDKMIINNAPFLASFAEVVVGEISASYTKRARPSYGLQLYYKSISRGTEQYSHSNRYTYKAI